METASQIYEAIQQFDPESWFYSRGDNVYVCCNLYVRELHLLCKDSCLSWPDFNSFDVNFHGVDDYSTEDAWVPIPQLTREQVEELGLSTAPVLFRYRIFS